MNENDLSPKYYTEKKAVEFTIESTHELDDEIEFLAIRVGHRSDETGWFNLYRVDYEMDGGHQLVRSLEVGQNLIEAAIDYMVEDLEYKRGRLSAKVVLPPEDLPTFAQVNE